MQKYCYPSILSTPNMGAMPTSGVPQSSSQYLLWSFCQTLIVFQTLWVQAEEVHSHSQAYGQQLAGVDGGLGENLLHGARMHMDAVGQPLVGVALPP